jgi:two-component system, NtrC family, response regulator
MCSNNSRPCTVLIADDVKEVRSFLVALLRREGFATVEAAEGIAALQAIRTGQADLVLLDVLLPGMSGMDVLREARKLTQTLPILLITGLGSIEAAVEAVKLGADDYLTKPMPNHELVQAIRRALNCRASRDTTVELPHEALAGGAR